MATQDSSQPAQFDTGAFKTLENLGVDELISAAIAGGEGVLSSSGALCCNTGEFTGRSPKDRYIVKDDKTSALIDWGSVNQPFSPEHFEALRKDQLAYLAGKELYSRDSLAGAAERYQLSVRVISETAWANLFCRQLFIRPTPAQLKSFNPNLTIIQTPGFSADPARHGTKSKTFVVLNPTQGLVLIGGTSYAGEMKKSVFSTLNYLYPQQGVLPMHCSANVSKSDPSNVALFFGLSGTGKTTLSADPHRRLIGDDEHGWSNDGVFNFEGGCYAKCINLSEEREPEIFHAIRKGAILENVVLNRETKNPDYTDSSLTENTRAAYPIEFIEDAVLSGLGAPPKNVIFLTCDAFGVMPPIAKLTEEQAMYHFLSGYTAKVAGTERGLGSEPQATFSSCFGSPFLPLPPVTYAKLLGEKLKRHGVACWLVNTGWVGGAYGEGERIKLAYTRRLINAALVGEFEGLSFKSDNRFNLAVPTSAPEVPASVLDQQSLWKDSSKFDAKESELAGRFTENFKKFINFSPEIAKHGGPKL